MIYMYYVEKIHDVTDFFTARKKFFANFQPYGLNQV